MNEKINKIKNMFKKEKVEIVDNKIENYDATEPRNPLDAKAKIKQMYRRTKSTRTFLINMQLFNGKHVQFIAIVNNNKFEYQGGTYIIDDNCKYENLSANLFCLDYHQGIAIPIKRNINYTELKKVVNQSNIGVENTINPISLKTFMESQVIEKIMKGEELDKLFRFLKIAMIINLGIGLIHLILFMQKSGMFQSVRI